MAQQVKPIERQVIIPTLGLYQGRPKHRIPLKAIAEGVYQCGLSDCRNISLSRKEECIKKSLGREDFTASATGATDSVRGIGVLNKYASPQKFETASTSSESVDASGEDVRAYGTTDYSITESVLQVGSVGATSSYFQMVAASADDCHTNSSVIWLDSSLIYLGGSYSGGFRFLNVTVAQGATIASAYIDIWGIYGNPGIYMYGDDADDAATFSTQADFDGRTRTTANQTASTQNGVFRRWDIKTVVQEIVDRASWSSGNAMAFLADAKGPGVYSGFSYDYEWPYAPRLYITVGSAVSTHAGLKFDGFSGLAQGDQVTSAAVKLKVQGGNGTPNIRIYGHDADKSWRDTGTHDGGNNEATVMTDSTASWTVDALIGLTIDNTTDGSTGTITDNDATTVTCSGGLSGGTDNDWDTNDKYEIYEPTVRTVFDGMQDHLTTAYVDWAPVVADLQVDDWAYTPDITAIIQEIVDRTNWDAASISLFFKDNSSTSLEHLAFYAYDNAAADAAELEVEESLSVSKNPTFFMYVNGGTEGEIWKLDANKVPSQVDQAAEAHANTYQSQIGKFLQFGDDLIFSDDGKSDIQQWDISDTPTNFEDSQTTVKGKLINEFKSRLWIIGYCTESATLYPNRAYYSAVGDQTSFSASDYISFPFSGSAPTAAINLTSDSMIVFKEGSTFRIVDRQTSASDFQLYTVSGQDGSMGANVVSDGGRIYGINDRGVFQWPVDGYPNGFRYISKRIQTEVDKVVSTNMNLVWFAHDPENKLIFMHYPDTGASRNTLCAVYNYERDVWENISNIWAANVMEHIFDLDGSSMMIFGQEDGDLKKISGTDVETANFSGYFDTAAIFRYENNNLLSRNLIGIEPDSNYDGSMTLNFYFKGYNRPDEEAAATWFGPYTHAGAVMAGNKEFVPIATREEFNYHIIRVDGPLKAEEFEIYGLTLLFAEGSRQ